jgi:hypothetical protein
MRRHHEGRLYRPGPHGRRDVAPAARRRLFGAKPAASIGEVSNFSRAVFTMLTDDAAVLEVVSQPGGLRETLPKPRRSRKYFGSLVLAVRDKVNKRWVYAGHVGTGFDQAALKSIYETMQPLRIDKKPFDQKIKDENATTWLTPKLVGEVKFAEWTRESEMRHPAFLGLRTDKKAIDVIREQA